MNGDILPLLGAIGEEIADGIVDAKLALRLLDQYPHCSELLGHGTKMKARLGCIGDFLGTVGQTIPLVEQDFPSLSDQDGAGKSAILCHLRQLCV